MLVTFVINSKHLMPHGQVIMKEAAGGYLSYLYISYLKEAGIYI